jgi:DNA-binding MarR family transcriptional regulator
MTISEQLDQALREWVKVFTRRTMREFHHSLRDSGLSPGQLQTLMRLNFHGGCQVSDIGDDLGVTAAAASQMVDRLVHMDLVERSEDPDDRRVKRITISKAGRVFVLDGLENRLKWMKDLANNLTAAEQEHILTALKTLTEAALTLEEQIHDEIHHQRMKV